jgi:hypothetical protein
MTAPPISRLDGDSTLVVEHRFAIVPEWVIDAEISDSAFRLYSVLLRYGQSSGARMPSRATLARRLKKRSVDSVDRAMRELVAIGAVVVERRRRGRQNLTNRYFVVTSALSGRTSAEAAERGSSRIVAAAGAERAGSRVGSATLGRTAAAGVVASLRPDPECLTQEKPPPPASAEAELCRLLGIGDFDTVVAACRSARHRLGLPTTRWTPRLLADCLRRAVVDHGWPASSAIPALLALAANPQTRSPARLEHPGPWWDTASHRSSIDEGDAAAELAQLEARLAEADGRRVWVQRQARRDLARDNEPVTRLSVARRACELLDRASVAGP